MNTPTPLFSIIVPVMNEAGNILPLAQAVDATMSQANVANGSYELIYVDDASRDTTVAEILQARAMNPKVRLLRLAENRGKSHAQHLGVQAARAKWVAIIDGDMQNPPSEIAKLIDKMQGYDTDILVAALREKRMDTASKRYASRAANRIRQWILKDDCPDAGCGLRLSMRDTYLRLPYFNSMHRYLPALFKMIGVPVTYVLIKDQPRTIGVSKYTNWQRALVGIRDLIGVRWLQSRTHPVRSWEE